MQIFVWNYRQSPSLIINSGNEGSIVKVKVKLSTVSNSLFWRIVVIMIATIELKGGLESLIYGFLVELKGIRNS